MSVYDQAVKDYYAVINEKNLPNNRKQKYVFSRAAITVALSKFASDRAIAKSLKKSRHSVIHYRNSHYANLFSPEYRYYYNEAVKIANGLNQPTMNEEEKQTYMNALWGSIQRYLDEGEERYASCLLSSYEAKVNLGWPPNNRS